MLGLLLTKKKLSDSTPMSTRDYWPDRASRMTQAGTLVDEATSLTYSAVFCATRVLTEGCGMVPLTLKKIIKDGTPEKATEMPQYHLTASQPNPDMPFGVFKAGRTMHQVNGGNGFAEIERERFGDPESPPVALWPIDACRVRPATYRDTDRRGRPLKPEDRYIVRNNDGSSQYFKSWEMLHLPGVLSEDGIWGKSIVAQARQNIGAGIAMDIHSATTFSSGKAPPAVVYGGAMRDEEMRRQFRREWKEVHGSPQSGEIALLPFDAKYEKIGMRNDEGQFVESGAFSVRKIARFWNVPVHMLMELMGPSGYNTVLQLSEEFVRFSLMTWLMLWEGQCNQKLLTPEERKTHYYSHDLEHLLKADPETRAKIAEIDLRCGRRSLNQVLRDDGMPTIGPAGDAHAMPMELTTWERLHEGLPPPSAIKAGDTAAKMGDGSKPAAAGKQAMMMPEDEKLLAVEDIRQEKSFDCGAVCTNIVANYFGKGGGTTPEEYIAELGTNETAGTQPEAIIDWLNDAGLVVTSGMGMSIDDLLCFFRKGMPVIIPLQLWGVTDDYDEEEEQNETGHYCTVNGVGLGMIFFMDPFAGQRMLPEAEFLRRWHDTEAEGVIDKRFGIAVSDQFVSDDEEDYHAQEQAAVAETKPKALPASKPDPGPGASAPVAVPVLTEAAREAPNPAGLSGGQLYSAQRVQALDAARAVLTATLSRLFTKEAKAAESEMKKTTDLGPWVGIFFEKHEQLVAKEIGPALAVLKTLGIDLDAAFQARSLARASIEELRKAFETDGGAALKARLAAWPTERAEREAKRIMGEADA